MGGPPPSIFISETKKNGTVLFFLPVGWISDWPCLMYVNFIFGLFDGSELVKSHIIVEKPVGWLDGSKINGTFFLACWMDLRLARFDICVESPVGTLDDQ